jgi:hypothetical protein
MFDPMDAYSAADLTDAGDAAMMHGQHEHNRRHGHGPTRPLPIDLGRCYGGPEDGPDDDE